MSAWTCHAIRVHIVWHLLVLVRNSCWGWKGGENLLSPDSYLFLLIKKARPLSDLETYPTNSNNRVASKILLGPCAFFSLDKIDRWFHPNRSLWADPRPLACSAECECFKVGRGRGGLWWMMRQEESVLCERISHWRSQNRLRQALMEGRGVTQEGLIAVWWPQVPQSQHHPPPRLPQVDRSLYPTCAVTA